MHTALLAVLLIASAASLGAETTKCERLSGLALANTTITVAEANPAGGFTPPEGDALDKLPAFCRVAGVMRPTSDSYIRFEVWMPAEGWNGKFLGVGNGGFAGAIDYRTLGGDLRRNYATAATDTGHQGEATDASWAYKHPEKVTDFGYRAVHETAEIAKKIIAEFYGRGAEHSYFDSCSDGGREALMEAQRFPEDYDGILAGAPAYAWTDLVSSGVEAAQRIYGNPASYISSFKVPAIGAAVLQACDAQDGVKDGIINDPMNCHFDPTEMLCKGAESRDCLTTAQAATLKVLYRGVEGGRGSGLFPGYMPGGETGPQGWSTWILGPGPGESYGVGYVENYFRYMVFEDPSWNVLTADVGAAKKAAERKTASQLDATNPDLHRFAARGGKLILYHGWNDPGIPPSFTIDYYKSVMSAMGQQQSQSFLRLYMVPGMQHCIGGPGATVFGQLGTTTAKGPSHGIYSALEEWVEKGTAPDEIIATKYADGKAVMTRPLCAYPEIARYKGTGDTSDSASFSCEAPK
ncbi:MAG: tannase/feruloyl esterase family alpha/beta hydrolase [Acidobacteriaceae bacterium]|nr:tannase/feruloyl esterase family alpha/beta hydrolase [Acidobacteriaceae bacterium]